MEISEIVARIKLLNMEIVQMSCALTEKKEELNKMLHEHKVLDRKLALMDGRFKVIASKNMRNTVRRTQAGIEEDILKDFKKMSDSGRKTFLSRLHA